MNFQLQAFGVYKKAEVASSIQSRDYKYVTDIITQGGVKV